MTLRLDSAPHIDVLLVARVQTAHRLALLGHPDEALAIWEGLLLGDGDGPRVLAGRLLVEVLLGRAQALAALRRWDEAMEALDQPLLVAGLEAAGPRIRLGWHAARAVALASLERWDEMSDAFEECAAIASGELEDGEEILRLRDELLSLAAEAQAWAVVEEEAREAMTSARLADRPGWATRAGWQRVRALSALGRRSQARAQAQELLASEQPQAPGRPRA